MSLSKIILSTVALVSLTATMRADSVAPFGVGSAYNLVALGTVDSNGATLLHGTISTQADVTGRIAAADRVLVGTTIGSSLNADPYGSPATHGLVSSNGLVAGQTFNMNGGGNAFA